MMDFYIINDEKPKPNSQRDLEFAGSIDESIFEILQSENIIEERFDYYTDFRLTNEGIKNKLNFINIENLESNLSILAFKEILVKANSKEAGLLAYSD